jgi:hypothetical protein
MENGGNYGKALAEVGYSPTVVKTPDKVTKSKSWKQLLEERLSNDLLSKKHLELLNKQEVLKIGRKRILVPETQAVSKGLEMAYKLKGYYAEDKATQNLNVVVVMPSAVINRTAKVIEPEAK